ncbi:S41 family peptidase [Salipaludibacillus agaradhaerens]|uniref:S41 family peptidase n=1 Tax=Salipaludibacillus agaradhaerens TaxID=76935 RepID=UPI000998363F|nr:S41 family peptidase [Salipaludibacillus agaradhaerens]
MMTWIISLLILCSLIAGCSEVVEPISDIEKLRDITIEERFSESVRRDEIEKYLHKENGDNEIESDDLNMLKVSNGRAETVTKEEMLLDSHLLNQIWSHSYALYEVYGGQDSFSQAHELLTATIEDEYSEGEEANYEEFIALISDHYAFITDQQLLIDGSPFFDREHQFYITEELTFVKDDNNNYWLYKDNHKKDKVVSINGDDPDVYLLPSLNFEGELVYFPGMYTDYLPQKLWDIDLENQETIEVTVRQSGLDRLRDTSFDVYEDEEVPIIQLRNMLVYKEDSYNYEDMLGSVDQVEDESTFILDLRNNNQGHIKFAQEWYKRLTSHEPSIKSYSAQLMTPTTITFLEDKVERNREAGVEWGGLLDTEDPFNINEYHDVTRLQWSIEEMETDGITELDSTIYILIDEATSASAEILVAYLRQHPNVYIVGAPSEGAMSSGNSQLIELPHSGAKVSIPSMFRYHPQFLEKEAIGIEPDLWVYPRFARERVVKWIDNNNDDL